MPFSYLPKLFCIYRCATSFIARTLYAIGHTFLAQDIYQIIAYHNCTGDKKVLFLSTQNVVRVIACRICLRQEYRVGLVMLLSKFWSLDASCK